MLKICFELDIYYFETKIKNKLKISAKKLLRLDLRHQICFKSLRPQCDIVQLLVTSNYYRILISKIY